MSASTERAAAHTAEVKTAMGDMISEVEEKLNRLADKVADEMNDTTGRTAEQTAEVKAALEELAKQLDMMKLELSDKIHAEDVQCYRNMADLIEEIRQKLEEDEEVEDGIYFLKGYVRILSIIAILNFVGVIALILYNFGIIRF